MPHSRRIFLTRAAGASAVALGLTLPQRAFADGVAIPYASENTSGSALSGGSLQSAIDRLVNERSLISLANENTLRAECARVADAAAQGIQKSTELRNTLNGQLTDAQISLGISGVSAIVGAIGAFAFVYTTSPVWVGLAVTIGTANAVWSLIQFEKTSGNDRAIVGVSHVAGRLSLIGSAKDISQMASNVARGFSVLGAATDTYFAIKAGFVAADTQSRIDDMTNNLTALRASYQAYAGDPAACRAARMVELDESIEALEFVRDLGNLSKSGGSIPLP
jgi:hypothetical protein